VADGTIAQVKALLAQLSPAELQEVDRLVTLGAPIWQPLPGPQTMAYESEADIIGYGGAAGGGKTDLLCGMALTQHTVAAIFRREATQLTGILDRLTAILGSTQGYNGQQKIWRLPNAQIEFGSTPRAEASGPPQGLPRTRRGDQLPQKPGAVPDGLGAHHEARPALPACDDVQSADHDGRPVGDRVLRAMAGRGASQSGQGR
jgi:hypothetical protein